jgi:PAS domain S-box-containing protein
MDRKPLRLLLAEDNPADAELILRELRNAGFKLDYQRVDTEAGYLSKLDPKIDIILSDFAMPQFTGSRALQLLKESNLDIPFILVSGTIGEDTAVAAMRGGAADYLLKDRLTRLSQSVEHALEEKQIRDERRTAEEKLQSLTRQHELILNSAGDGIFGVDLNGNIIFQNPKAAELLKWGSDELSGKPAHSTEKSSARLSSSITSQLRLRLKPELGSKLNNISCSLRRIQTRCGYLTRKRCGFWR